MAKELRLLIIEDSEDDTLLLVRELRKGGFEPAFTRVETLQDLETALDVPDWDAIISDFNLPGFNGLDALRLVQMRGQDLPFILISGMIGEEKAVEAMKAGAHDYIMKGRYSRLVPAMERELREAANRREQRHVAEVLREKEHMLIQQSRQAAMGEMIGNIAHQWRQPLNALGLTIQGLLLFYDLDEFNREFLEKGVGSSMELIQHMSRTIDDFRNYFRPDKEKSEFKVAEAVENTLSLIEDSFKNQHIDIEIVAKKDPVIYGYRNEFAQALLNILNNARDALTERDTDHPRVKITICSEGDRTVVTVADNAGGIPEEIMCKIFDPYFTTKGPQSGTGVGLFMSKTIIEKNMGGRLMACNIVDGAEFRIEV